MTFLGQWGQVGLSRWYLNIPFGLQCWRCGYLRKDQMLRQMFFRGSWIETQVPPEIPWREDLCACSGRESGFGTLGFKLVVKTYLKSFNSFFSKKAGQKSIVNRVEPMTGAFCFCWRYKNNCDLRIHQISRTFKYIPSSQTDAMRYSPRRNVLLRKKWKKVCEG